MEGAGSIILIVGCLVLAGIFIKAIADHAAKEDFRHPKLRDGIVVFSHNCGSIVCKEKDGDRSVTLSPDTVHPNHWLQQRVKSYVSHTPINTELRITNYAWDLTDALELANLLDDYWDPVAAFYFANGVVMVRYMERPREGVKVSDEKKDLYFAASDGHLIYFKA